MQGTDKLNTITNIVFVLTDVLETNLLEMQQKYKKEGFELRHDPKRNFNTAIAAIKRLKSDVNHCSESTQENFGNDSDMVNAMLLTLIVTPYVGVWIETPSTFASIFFSISSHPTWVCGLKLLVDDIVPLLDSHTLRGCVD